MNLRPYIEGLHRQLLQAAEPGGEEARTVAERLVAPLEAAMRLALQDALSAAVEEITCELAPGSVELRLRGQDPEFVVTLPPAEDLGSHRSGVEEDRGAAAWAAEPMVLGVPGVEAEESEPARINLRLPDHLKVRVEGAARREGLSTNAWLVRAAARALERLEPSQRFEPSTPLGNRRFTGWVR
jgi:hypothetical protein